MSDSDEEVNNPPSPPQHAQPDQPAVPPLYLQAHQPAVPPPYLQPHEPYPLHRNLPRLPSPFPPLNQGPNTIVYSVHAISLEVIFDATNFALNALHLTASPIEMEGIITGWLDNYYGRSWHVMVNRIPTPDSPGYGGSDYIFFLIPYYYVIVYRVAWLIDTG